MDTTTLRVRAKPRSRVELLTRGDDGILIARVTAPPVDGKANAAIERLIAGRLGLRRNEVTITSGAGSRLKRVEIRSADAAGLRAALAKLETE